MKFPLEKLNVKGVEKKAVEQGQDKYDDAWKPKFPFLILRKIKLLVFGIHAGQNNIKHHLHQSVRHGLFHDLSNWKHIIHDDCIL